jgi:hypothetical protein
MKDPNKANTKRGSTAQNEASDNSSKRSTGQRLKTKRRLTAKKKHLLTVQNTLKHKPLKPDTRTPDSFYLTCGGVFPHKPNQ